MERTYLALDYTSHNRETFAVWRYLTSSSWVVSGHLSEVGMVLYYNWTQVSLVPRKFLGAQVNLASSSVAYGFER